MIDRKSAFGRRSLPGALLTFGKLLQQLTEKDISDIFIKKDVTNL